MKNTFFKIIILLAVSAVNIFSNAKAQSTPTFGCMKIGASIHIGNSSSFFPFVDFFKCNTGWTKDQYSSSRFDKDGYKTNGATQITSIYLNEVPANMIFTILWDGVPTDSTKSPLIISGMNIIPNTFKRLPTGGSIRVAKSSNVAYISIVNSQTTVDPSQPVHIRNIRMIRSGFENSYLSNPFNPEFLEQVKGMSYIKVNPWMTNYNTSGLKSDWTKRTTPTSMSQCVVNVTPSFISANLAYEHMIQLANITNKDLWVNVPYDADSVYVMEMAKLFKSRLSTDIKVFVETSHEIWNFSAQFPAYNYFSAMAGGEANKTQDTIAYTIKRNWRIFKDIVGERVQKVLGAQVGYRPHGIIYFAQEKYTGKDKFDIIAIAQYLSVDKERSQMIESLGASATPEQLNAAVLESWNQSNFKDTLFGLIMYTKAAKKAGSKLWIYEGNTEYYSNSGGSYKLLPKAEEAGMHKASLAPLFSAAFDTLKRYGIDAFTLSGLNGSKSSVNYAIMGGTFSHDTSTGNGLKADAKYEVIMNYMSTQNCAITSVINETHSNGLDIDVYPNPTIGSFKVKSTEIDDGQMLIECYNSTGNSVYRGSLGLAQDIEILINQPSGIYQLVITARGRKTTKKIIKE